MYESNGECCLILFVESYSVGNPTFALMILKSINTGFFKLDGGAMFGVVPRRMWSKLNPPDENNLCTWALRTLLVQTGGRNILIDTGIGNKQDEKFRAHFEPFGSETLFDSLRKAGLRREDITDVFLTHLHFDHCGGALWKNEASGLPELSFPNATYWSNEQHFNWAMKPNDREKASFLKENFLPLQELGKLKFLAVQENIEFCPGFNVRFVYGHTEAMMVPVLQSAKGTLIYCADAMPSQWHIGMPYVMAYDVRPLITMEEKAKMLMEAVALQQVLFFEHDPIAECATVRREDSGRIVLDQVGMLNDILIA
jgi:glyoxylase-like metal-dependent hydrolase (beta-lactamase superfamily II)